MGNVVPERAHLEKAAVFSTLTKAALTWLAGIYFEDNDVKRVVTSRAGAKAYYVSVVNGKVVERVFEPEMIS